MRIPYDGHGLFNTTCDVCGAPLVFTTEDGWFHRTTGDPACTATRGEYRDGVDQGDRYHDGFTRHE